MSISDKEISRIGGTGVDNGGGENGDNEDDENCGVYSKDDYRKKKIGGNGYGGRFSRNLGKAKKMVLRPFTRSKKQIPTKIQTSASSSSASASAANIGNFPGKRTRVDTTRVKGCCFCFRQPLTLESSIGSSVRNPKDPNWTHDKLKVFIEKNDFYSKECNPHLDIDCSHRED